ncbi:hypothetical protein HGA91_00760 [candidate division WWE3 bacterium]|nr:hypothetical protein [candidate division WWE3 bacterium]
MENLSVCIEKTLIYFRLFNFAPTINQLFRYLITSQPIPEQLLISNLPACSNVITQDKRYYLSRNNMGNEMQNETRSWELIACAQSQMKTIFNLMPFIHTIAISGSTAALNADESSDIDIMIICRPDAGWITRLLLILILTIRGQRIHLGEDGNRNLGKYCVNLIIEDNPITLLADHQDLYTASEIAHLKVIANRNNGFEHFLYANSWMQQYLGNSWSQLSSEWESPKIKEITSRSLFLKTINKLSLLIQQHMYQAKHKRPLTLSKTWTIDYRTKTLQLFEDSWEIWVDQRPA